MSRSRYWRLPTAAAAALIMVALWVGAVRAQQPPAPDAGASIPSIELVEVAAGLTFPLQVTHAGDGSGRLFVVERQGVVRIIDQGVLLAQPFLDITSVTNSDCNECGLLGLAFPPDFDASGVFYAAFTARGDLVAPDDPDEPDPADGNDSVIARFRVTANNPNRADPASRTDILRVNQPYQNHNGGQITFGPDGMLYITLGDGGSSGDPLDTGQRRETLLGKVLRVQVGSSGGYTVPADNPFVGMAGVRPEIWLWGLRNPWRWSFDRATGDLWMGDVGQNAWEEVNFVPAAELGGQNFGWKIREGSGCFRADTCSDAGLTAPIFEYPHQDGDPVGRSVTGGYVYRGPEHVLNGVYFFGDLSGWIGALQRTGAGIQFEQMLVSGFSLVTFGEDEAGGLYVTDYGGGRVLRIEARADFPFRTLLPMVGFLN